MKLIVYVLMRLIDYAVPSIFGRENPNCEKIPQMLWHYEAHFSTRFEFSFSGICRFSQKSKSNKVGSLKYLEFHFNRNRSGWFLIKIRIHLCVVQSSFPWLKR